jgi:hypothetical protein
MNAALATPAALHGWHSSTFPMRADDHATHRLDMTIKARRQWMQEAERSQQSRYMLPREDYAQNCRLTAQSDRPRNVRKSE